MNALIRLISFIARHPLNATSWQARWAGINRMLRWQIASRLLPEALHALPFVNGSRLLATRGTVGVTGNWYCGLDEPADMGFLLHLLRDGDHFVDVGANVGSYSVLACSVAGVTASSFEPIPDTFAKLEQNLALNGYANTATARQAGVSDLPGKLRFTTAQDSMNHVLADGELTTGAVIEVDVVRLDDVLIECGSKHIVIKIDVEGHEMAVLQGAGRILGSGQVLAVLMETNSSAARYGIADDALFAAMNSHGFTPCRYDVFTRKLTVVPAVADRELNTIFIRDLPEASSRLTGAMPFMLNGQSI